MKASQLVAVVLVASLLAACSGSDATDPREVLEEFVASVDSGDVESTLEFLTGDASWSIGGIEIRLDQSLPDDLVWLQQVFGLDDAATGRDVFAAYLDYLAIAAATITLSQCSAPAPDSATCRVTIRDRISAVSGVEESGTISITAEGDRIDRLAVDTTPRGEPDPSYDAFRRWAAVTSPAPTEDPGLIEQARQRVRLLDEWERAGRPDLPPPVADDDAVTVVEAWLRARNRGDWETLVSLTGGDALDDPFASRAEFEAAQLLDRDVSPSRVCAVTASGSTGDFVACDVVVTDIIVDTAGTQSTNLNDSTFRVMNGRVIDVPGWIPSSYLAEQAIEQWAEDAVPDAYRIACPDGIAGQSPIDGFECARFIAGHRDEWAPAVADLGLGD